MVYPTPLTVSGLSVTFDAQLTGGTGADGLTMALLDPAGCTATSVGGTGAELGFGGLTGVAVTLVTHQHPGYPAGNFIGISTGLGKALGAGAFQSFAQGIAPLRDGTHTVGIKVVRGGGTDVLIVTLDGEQVFQSAEPPAHHMGRGPAGVHRRHRRAHRRAHRPRRGHLHGRLSRPGRLLSRERP